MAHHHHNGPGPEALPSRFVPVASPGALMGVDWESRVDFERLRRYRMGRVKEKLNESSLGVAAPLRHEQHPVLDGGPHRQLGPRQALPLRPDHA